ncbi:hypothetical protein [Microbacterium sp. PA5]|uniref:hypothetical protein n=1 Tax=Microbacterium sp. PA5 TaxID=3416654 RepID=UPI003CF16A24
MHLDENSCNRAESLIVDNDYPQRFSDALISEIKAEMGRRDLMSSRALGRLIGKSSQYMSDRLDGGNSKTGKRVTLTITDVMLIANALEIDATDLIDRAERYASGAENVVRGRFGVGRSPEDLPAAARTTDPESGEDQD